MPEIGHHQKHEGNDRIKGYELDTLVPVRLFVAADQCSKTDAEKKGANLSPAERQIQRLWRDEVTCDHKERRDKQRNLNRTAERDADGQIQSVSPCHRQCRPTFGGASDDSKKDDPDKSI